MYGFVKIKIILSNLGATLKTIMLNSFTHNQTDGVERKEYSTALGCRVTNEDDVLHRKIQVQHKVNVNNHRGDCWLWKDKEVMNYL